MWVKSTQFGSWTYDGTKLDLQPDGADMDMSEYLVNGEWNLYSEFIYEMCPNEQKRPWNALRSSTSAVRSRTRL